MLKKSGADTKVIVKNAQFVVRTLKLKQTYMDKLEADVGTGFATYPFLRHFYSFIPLDILSSRPEMIFAKTVRLRSGTF